MTRRWPHWNASDARRSDTTISQRRQREVALAALRVGIGAGPFAVVYAGSRVRFRFRAPSVSLSVPTSALLSALRAVLRTVLRPSRLRRHSPTSKWEGRSNEGVLRLGGAAARAGRWLISRWVWRRSMRCGSCRITCRVLLPRSPPRHCPRRPQRLRPLSTLSSASSPAPSWFRQQISVSDWEG